MLNLQTLWQEIQAADDTAYLVCATDCQVIVQGEVISQSMSMTTAIEQAWLRVCVPRQEPDHATPA